MTKEREVYPLNGWIMLGVNLATMVGCIILFIKTMGSGEIWPGVAVMGEVLAILSLTGHFTLQPNEARLLILFGSYKGTVKTSGFFWANPFYSKGFSLQTTHVNGQVKVSSSSSKTRISLRLRNLNVPQLKVNDKRGNPIEIAAVVVWRVQDTAQSAFDVDDYESFVHLQSETALRHVANSYAYDQGEADEITLLSGVEEVSLALKAELEQRLAKAGITVEEVRLTHLAYAPEIAGAMLRRQQAEAVIAARQKIVLGAVSMVQMALQDLSDKKVVELDEERKAAMVSNLLVVLCGERDTQPVVNTGSLYQ